MHFDIGFVSAETHTPEYLMHKYWARKPHNVISDCISKIIKTNGVIIDPFCGSGSTIREGALLGNECYGFDINPSATLISSVLVAPPKKGAFLDAFCDVYDKIYSKYNQLYKTLDGQDIKYLSHRIVAHCACGRTIFQKECHKNGNKLICPFCEQQVRFNLENMATSEIFAISVNGNKNLITHPEELVAQEKLSDFIDEDVNYNDYNYVFPTNRRILAFEGLHTKNFFTNRNFTILCAFADEIWKIKDNTIRDCALLLLTASVAQCSRLIAHRNNLSTGGPAWSVPGFWVPQEHLETNPFIHIRARIQKFSKALDYLEKHPITGLAKIQNGNSLDLLNDNAYGQLKADLIFLDPPYGDSVPYTEFSNIWNSFLKAIPNFSDDISVTDRINKNDSWKNYDKKLNEYMNCFAKHLKNEGKLLITFNNNDMKAWQALISALQNNHFICNRVFYQIPAVISSKSQMSINTSYISDIYSVYTHKPDCGYNNDLSDLISHLCFITNARKGRISKVVLDREFIMSWLRYNIQSGLLTRKTEIISSLFDYDKENNSYILKQQYYSPTKLLETEINNVMYKILSNGPETVLNCYKKVSVECEKFGIMELAEFKEIITKGYVIQDGSILGSVQLSLL